MACPRSVPGVREVGEVFRGVQQRLASVEPMLVPNALFIVLVSYNRIKTSLEFIIITARPRALMRV
jgi:hypothetical protein